MNALTPRRGLSPRGYTTDAQLNRIHRLCPEPDLMPPYTKAEAQVYEDKLYELYAETRANAPSNRFPNSTGQGNSSKPGESLTERLIAVLKRGETMTYPEIEAATGCPMKSSSQALNNAYREGRVKRVYSTQKSKSQTSRIVHWSLPDDS